MVILLQMKNLKIVETFYEFDIAWKQFKQQKDALFPRAFNDLDHFSPIANLYLEQEILVKFSFTEKFISGEDPRLSVLNRHESFSVITFRF